MTQPAASQESMRAVIFKVASVVSLWTLLAGVACTASPAVAPTQVPAPTPNVQATIDAAVSATVTALITPTPVVAVATSVELSSAATRAAFLTTRYGVDPKQVVSLTKSTYDAAARLGLGTTEQRTALDMTVLDFAEHGGSGLRNFGVEGDDDSVARQLGLSTGSALAALTPNQVVQVRTLIATIGLTKFVIGN